MMNTFLELATERFSVRSFSCRSKKELADINREYSEEYAGTGTDE